MVTPGFSTACFSLLALLMLLMSSAACSTHTTTSAQGQLFYTEVLGTDQPLVAGSEYLLWMPAEVERAQCILVINQRGAGKRLFFDDHRWRELAARIQAPMLYCKFEARSVRDNGYGHSILKACEQFASQLGHPELKDAPFILWGHSMGGRVAQDFVRFKPERVAAYIIAMRAHPSPPALMVEEPAAMQVPALYLMGSQDGKPEDIFAHFVRAREHASARAWVWLPGQKHWPEAMGHGYDQTTDSDWNNWTANDLVLPWIEAVLQNRLPKDSTSPSGPVHLQPLRLTEGWFVDMESGEVFRDNPDLDKNPSYSWLPTKQTAEQWRQITQFLESPHWPEGQQVQP